MESTNESRTLPPAATVDLLLDVKPFLLLCKMCGLLPFSVDARSVSISQTRSDKRNHTIFQGLQIVNTVVSLCYCISILPKQSTIHILLVACNVSYNMLTIITLLRDTLYSEEEFENVLQLICFIDSKLCASPAPITTSIAKFLRLQLISFLLVTFGYFLFAFHAMRGAWRILGSVCCIRNITVNMITLLRFGNMQLLVRERLKVMNGCLFNWFSGASKGNRMRSYLHQQFPHSKKKQVAFQDNLCSSHEVRSLRKGYGALCDISEVTTRIHEKFLALFLCVGFLTTTLIVCFMVTKENILTLNVPVLGVMIAAISMQIVPVLLVLFPAHCVTSEARRTARLASALLLRCCPSNRGVHRELSLMARQTLSVMPKSTLLDALTLNLELVFLYVSFVTTYSTLLLTSGR